MYSFYSTHTYGGQPPAGGTRYAPSLPGAIVGQVQKHDPVGNNQAGNVTGTLKVGGYVGNSSPMTLSGEIKTRNNWGNVI